MDSYSRIKASANIYGHILAAPVSFFTLLRVPGSELAVLSHLQIRPATFSNSALFSAVFYSEIQVVLRVYSM
jgi:hypothetical protein